MPPLSNSCHSRCGGGAAGENQGNALRGRWWQSCATAKKISDVSRAAMGTAWYKNAVDVLRTCHGSVAQRHHGLGRRPRRAYPISRDNGKCRHGPACLADVPAAGGGKNQKA
mmetsp:Transcript_97696/g.276364  ORF Transcript_97696/g.276364 Transcript_97696/m.276364 type:complete len:112 (+) Transcript_97696:1941-2276(+)